MAGDAPLIDVRELTTLKECQSVDPLFADVWGPDSPPIGVEMLRALSHAGGYLAGAFHQGSLVGASVGFVAHKSAETLHSHTTGVRSSARGLGVGYLLKEHQKRWALDRSIATITWTFDPLVRRNAWFNITKLRAIPTEYLVDFYGQMPDSINRSDDSDRLYTVWAVHEQPTVKDDIAEAAQSVLALDGSAPETQHSDADLVLVATPPDIEGLRQSEPGLARTWRISLREILSAELNGGKVVGFTPAGEYVIRRRSRADTQSEVAP